MSDVLTTTAYVQAMTFVHAECLQLPFVFDGNVASLPRASPAGERFVSTPFLTSACGKRLFVASVKADTAGGRRGTNHERPRETLCALLVEPPDFFPAERYVKATWSCVRFYWLPHGSKNLRYAPLVARGDNEKSLCVHYRTLADARERMVLHGLLGWTFCCTPDLLRLRWDTGYDINHIDTNHGRNFLNNVEPRRATGQGGHRQESGALGPPAKRRRW